MGGTSKDDQLPKTPTALDLSPDLKYGDKGEAVKRLKEKINPFGYALDVDNGNFLAITQLAVKDFQKRKGLEQNGIVSRAVWELLLAGPSEEDKKWAHKENPAYIESKKYEGKKETDPTFNKWLSGFWAIVGLRNYKTIIGTTFAWCGLFIAAMNSEVGQEWIANGAGAKNWAKYGQEIKWKENGIPRGAVVHLDHDCDCKGDSNHVGFADGDCTAEDLKKPGAKVNIFGGNQSNAVNTRSFPVCEICAVRWPKEIELPGKILKSVNCSGSSTRESTR